MENTNKPITLTCGVYDRILPLYIGDVSVKDFNVKVQFNSNPRDIFDKMARKELEISEFSFSEYAVNCAEGKNDFVAIPAFASRVFRHGFICVNNKAGINGPKDLAGKRIGVQVYTMSAAVVIRGILENEYGVDLSEVRWVEGALEKPGRHGAPVAQKLHKNVQIEANETDKSLNDLLEEGKIDAFIGATTPSSLKTSKNVRRLFVDYQKEEEEFYKRTGIFPIMHVFALRRDVHEAHPGLAQALYNALCESKKISQQRMCETGALAYMLPWLPAHVEATERVFGQDPWPYGLEANRTTLTAQLKYLLQQGLINRPLTPEEIFVPVKE